MMGSRRDFLRHAGVAMVPMALLRRAGQDPAQAPARPAAGAVAADTLGLPIGGRSRVLGPLDNDAGVIAIERRLRCSCGCTLDVYTCRTTDFSCTYSPAMHAEVVKQVQRGATPAEIVAWFVAQPEYGEKVLMAPAPQGFNLMGYLVPGLTVTAFGLVLAAWLVRRRPTVDAGAPGVPVARGGDGPAPDASELERLKRALDDVDS